MSIGGSSNLGTLLIRRLDTALSVQASQQSQIVNAARSDAVAQLADAARISPVHNEGGRPLPETIEKAQAQVGRQARQPAESGRLQHLPPGSRHTRAVIDTSSTPSAPTTLGRAARTILALLSLFPDQAPPVRGRNPLLQSGPGHANASPASAGTSTRAPGGASAPSAQGSATTAAGSTSAASQGVPVAASAGATGGLSAQIMQALSMALQQSGAFYESHLHDLALGKRSAAQLNQEPQARPSAPAGQTATHQAAATAPNAAATTTQTPNQATEGTSSEGRSPTTAAAQASASSSQSLTGLHPDTQPIVRQQLEILAGQVFNWRGDAWPDASMEWEIARQNEDGLPDEAGTHWATSLRLQLPSLGEVEARLSLHDKQVVMRLVAPQSAQTLVQNDQALRAGFHDAGLTLSQLTILEEKKT
ncbi:flagellar hook-length control protein FliK [Pusillimonas sp.]|uniref:flagellar hook-length control protein FliK n=1 Tax=Pusillimonas sp. TaxID=3040095 RepID=UPI0037CA7CA2